MDDPWGSPWANESPQPLPNLDKPVSRGPVTSEKALGASHDNRSPWDDDEGYGEWATLPATDEVRSDEQVGPEQAESVEWNISIKSEPTPRKDYTRLDGSAWFSRNMLPTGRENLEPEFPQVADRNFSLDPWADEAGKAKERPRLPFVPKSNTDEEPSTNGLQENVAHLERLAVENNDRSITQSSSSLGNALNSNGNEVTIENQFLNHNQHEDTADLDENATDMQATINSHGDSVASRPSSSPSDHSLHDEASAESPRTSFEEDDKNPRVEREGCSKVKEMVRLFDGLAGDEGSAELPTHPGGSDANDDLLDTPVAAQPEEDFGDFEEGISYINAKLDLVVDVPVTREGSILSNKDTRSNPKLPETIEEPTVQSIEQPLKHHVAVTFEPDLSLLGQVLGQMPDFDDIHADPSQASDLDTLIEDSFSSTDQRKIWYRISRYSTMRKHNAGDEDSYVRVNWRDAAVRLETLKVVERWIEEDRIGGGIMLGGGTRSGFMFGWGQNNAAPMSVAAALASRSGNVGMHSDFTIPPTSIKGSDASPISTSLDQVSTPRNSFQSSTSATAPHFSWSTGTTSTTAETISPVVPPHMSTYGNPRTIDNSLSAPTIIREHSSRNLPVTEARPVTSKSHLVHRSEKAEKNSPRFETYLDTQKLPEPAGTGLRSEPDNDWGEMISSLAEEHPQSIEEGFQNQTDSKAVETFSPSLLINSPSSSITASQLENGGGSGASLAGIATKLEIKPSTAPTPDAWAGADFSFFDSPASSNPMRISAPLTVKSMPSVLAKENCGPTREEVEQMEQDNIVKSIVKNLPDLSYMLRR